MHRPGIEPGANGPHEASGGKPTTHVWQPLILPLNQRCEVVHTTHSVSIELLIPGFERGTFRVLSGRYDQLNHTSRLGCFGTDLGSKSPRHAADSRMPISHAVHRPSRAEPFSLFRCRPEAVRVALLRSRLSFPRGPRTLDSGTRMDATSAWRPGTTRPVNPFPDPATTWFTGEREISRRRKLGVEPSVSGSLLPCEKRWWRVPLKSRVK